MAPSHNMANCSQERFSIIVRLLKLYNGTLLVGAELKAIYNKINIEVLAYGMDYRKIHR